MIWDQDAELVKDPPVWSLTGRMCLWADGSPAHVQQERFRLMGAGWEAYALISRSTQAGSKWLAITLRLEADVRAQWDTAGIDPSTTSLCNCRITCCCENGTTMTSGFSI